MKRFKFRLQSVLDYRSQVKRDIEDKLALKNKELQCQQQILEEIKRRNDVIGDQLENALRCGCDAQEAKLYAYYRRILETDIALQQKRVDEIRNEVDALRQRLLEAVKDEKMLDALRERYWNAYMYDFNREEERIMDSILSYERFEEVKDAGEK